MSEEEESFIVCALVKPGLPVSAGSRQLPCSSCGRNVWVAASSAAWLARGIPIMCGECTIKELEARKDNEPVTMFVSQESLEEARLYSQRN